MRPATMIALVFLVAVIFVPAMFIDIKGISEGVPPDSNGLTPPPLEPMSPGPAPESNAPAEKPARNGAADNRPAD